MSLAAHLSELRKRLFRSAAALALGAVAGWFLSDYALAALRGPVLQIAAQQGRDATLNYDSITGAFDLKMQMAVTIGVIVASPIWL